MSIAPGNGRPDGDVSRLRASDSDRDRAVDVLKSAFAEGRLTKDEYDDRLNGIYASRTYGELGVLTSDLPVGPLGAMPQRVPGPVYLPPRPTNGLAIASLVLALAQPFALGITTIPAVVCGHMARRQIRRTGESGMGMATVGVVFGWIGIAFLTVIVTAIIVAVATAASHTGPPAQIAPQPGG
jgi:uncharacterized membrane protein